MVKVRCSRSAIALRSSLDGRSPVLARSAIALRSSLGAGANPACIVREYG